jgi:TRAP-type C4-dicarboxylate transport system permease small subunit
MSFLRKISDIIERVESFLIFLLVAAMVLLSFLQIILRNFFALSIFWIDDFTRHAVLWVGFLAASVVTIHARHINIDLLSRAFKGKSKRVLNIIKNLFSAFVSAILLYASLKFISYEKSGGEVSLTLKVPVWYLELIFPFSFSLITFRFIILTLEEILGKSKKEEEKKEGEQMKFI